MRTPSILFTIAAALAVVAVVSAIVQPIHWERTSGLALVLGIIVAAVALRLRTSTRTR